MNSRSVTVYTDGSNCPTTNRYGYGCVFLDNDNNVIKKLYGKGSRKSKTASRNISGELLGAMKAIEWAVNNGYKFIHIYADYIGVKMWAEGHWKANTFVAQEYIDFISEYSKKIVIRFSHIKGHSGNEYNEMADRLAKKSLGIG